MKIKPKTRELKLRFGGEYESNNKIKKKKNKSKKKKTKKEDENQENLEVKGDRIQLKLECLVNNLTLHIEFLGDENQILTTWDLKMNKDSTEIYEFFLTEMKDCQKLGVKIDTSLKEKGNLDFKLDLGEPGLLQIGKSFIGTIQERIQCTLTKV